MHIFLHEPMHCLTRQVGCTFHSRASRTRTMHSQRACVAQGERNRTTEKKVTARLGMIIVLSIRADCVLLYLRTWDKRLLYGVLLFGSM